MTNVGDTVRALRRDPMYLQFGEHPMLRYLQGGDIDLVRLRWTLQQYWHPIHYFSAFLASCIVVLKDLHLRSRVSLILFQELGKGDVKAAHERLYIDAAQRIGILDICDGAALPATAKLIDEYRTAAHSEQGVIGALFATELIDLRLVTCLGAAIKRVGGGPASKWQLIHERQERDHVAAASEVLAGVATADEEAVAEHARRMWSRWVSFLDGLHGEHR